MSKASFRTTPSRRFPYFWIAVLCILAGLLAAVAFLQFRSNTQIGEATEARIGGNVESLMMDWDLDFYRRLSAICIALQVGPDSGALDEWSDFKYRYTQWRQTAQAPELVQDLFILETSQKTAPRLLRVDARTKLLQEATPAASFEPLFSRLKSRSGNLYSGLRAWQPSQSELLQSISSPQYLSLQSDPLTGWQFEQYIPAIVHPIVHHKRPTTDDDPTSPEAIDWIIIVLDLHTIQTHIFPELALHHFGPSNSAEYFSAVAALGNPNRILYDSSATETGAVIDRSDAVMNIFGPSPSSIEASFWQAVKSRNSVRVQNWRHFSGTVWFPVIHYSNLEDPWMLILTHREGHLEDVVAQVRRVNLLTNGVVLLLLAAGISVAVFAGLRAQSYARMQMDFVASVSHELRTPLTAIFSAGENLADGVVEKKAQLKHYGSIITGQARQLITLVDQILTFSSSRSGDKRYELRPLDVSQIIDTALKNIHEIVEAGSFTVDVEIAPNLPPVNGNLSAIASCIQNLLSNAMKYSGKSRWIRVSAHLGNARSANEIQIEVQDRGIGIEPGELTHVFKPFYRSSQVKAAQIRGTGLGLAVAKDIAEAMGGRLSVRSVLGTGSTFTLSLPYSTENRT